MSRCFFFFLFFFLRHHRIGAALFTCERLPHYVLRQARLGHCVQHVCIHTTCLIQVSFLPIASFWCRCAAVKAQTEWPLSLAKQTRRQHVFADVCTEGTFGGRHLPALQLIIWPALATAPHRPVISGIQDGFSVCFVPSVFVCFSVVEPCTSVQLSTFINYAFLSAVLERKKS